MTPRGNKLKKLDKVKKKQYLVSNNKTMQTEMKITEFLEIWKIFSDNKTALVNYNQKPIETDEFIDLVSKIREKIIELQTQDLRFSSPAKDFKDFKPKTK